MHEIQCQRHLATFRRPGMNFAIIEDVAQKYSNLSILGIFIISPGLSFTSIFHASGLQKMNSHQKDIKAVTRHDTLSHIAFFTAPLSCIGNSSHKSLFSINDPLLLVLKSYFGLYVQFYLHSQRTSMSLNASLGGNFAFFIAAVVHQISLLHCINFSYEFFRSFSLEQENVPGSKRNHVLYYCAEKCSGMLSLSFS